MARVSRDWAAKGTNLLGVKAVVAQSFERIHRSNLVGMGVLPLQFKDGTTAQSLKLDGTETFDIVGLDGSLRPQQDLTLQITRDGTVETCRSGAGLTRPLKLILPARRHIAVCVAAVGGGRLNKPGPPEIDASRQHDSSNQKLNRPYEMSQM